MRKIIIAVLLLSFILTNISWADTTGNFRLLLHPTTKISSSNWKVVNWTVLPNTAIDPSWIFLTLGAGYENDFIDAEVTAGTMFGERNDDGITKKVTPMGDLRLTLKPTVFQGYPFITQIIIQPIGSDPKTFYLYGQINLLPCNYFFLGLESENSFKKDATDSTFWGPHIILPFKNTSLILAYQMSDKLSDTQPNQLWFRLAINL